MTVASACVFFVLGAVCGASLVLWLRWAEAIFRVPPVASKPRPPQHTYRPSPPPLQRSQWTGAGSLTEDNIRHHLQFGPMTREQLNDVLDTQTAGLCLPRMVERGLVRKLPGTRPFRYELVAQPLTDDAVDPHADSNTGTPTPRDGESS